MEPTTPPPVSSLVTPVSGNLVYANFGRRLLAVLIDMVILWIISFIIILPFTVIGAVTSSSAGETSALASLLMFVGQSLGWIVNVAYLIYFIGAKGQTPGKMAMKIKVVTVETGQVPGYLGAFLREVIGKFLSSMVVGLGYLWMLWDPKKQTWHDKIAKTVVVRV